MALSVHADECDSGPQVDMLSSANSQALMTTSLSRTNEQMSHSGVDELRKRPLAMVQQRKLEVQPPAKRPRSSESTVPQDGPVQSLSEPQTILSDIPAPEMAVTSAPEKTKTYRTAKRKTPTKLASSELETSNGGLPPQEADTPKTKKQNAIRTPAPKKARTAPKSKAKRNTQVNQALPVKRPGPKSALKEEPQSTPAVQTTARMPNPQKSEVTDTTAKAVQHPDSAAQKREKTVAFMMHVRKYAVEFKISPPRSERQFIWRFIEEIPDSEWSTFFQKKLLEMHPTSVRPSLGVRAKHAINFDAGLEWRHVLEAIRSLQPPRPAS